MVQGSEKQTESWSANQRCKGSRPQHSLRARQEKQERAKGQENRFIGTSEELQNDPQGQ